MRNFYVFGIDPLDEEDVQAVRPDLSPAQTAQLRDAIESDRSRLKGHMREVISNYANQLFPKGA